MQAFQDKASVTFIADDDEIENLKDILERNEGNDISFLTDLLDLFGFSPNNVLHAISPTDVGALSDAPLVSDEVEYTEDGQRRVTGNVFYYAPYMVRHFGQELVKHGKVTFTMAPT